MEKNVENLRRLFRKVHRERTRMNCGEKPNHPHKRLKYKALPVSGDSNSLKYRGLRGFKYL